ncbi:restriction endonuclease subunit S [Acinetobacter junii]|uniref:restriction endonuclease subunit S n=1 Tax=Acinetobacter junii TaxID=40215 RepID=UPI0013E92648|nr:restriction endonuclease subunit S [Acinetobacter junii]
MEWLGDVPEHWGVNRLGVHFKNRKEKVSDKDFKPLSVTKHGIVPQLEHAAKSDNGDNRKLVRKGDYVINSRSDRKGSSGLADLDGSVSLINIVLTPFKTIHPKFSHYLLRSYLFQEEFYKYGHGIVADLWTTNYEDMRNIHLALPSVSEQTQISNFLEQETTRIDNLIAKQEKLIELLEEQRKSIISHAVTKGLNPNAPMKDGGVEWLGEVPEHWMTPSSKHLLEIPITDGPHETPNFVDDGVPFISAEAISKGKIDFDKKRGYITPELNAIYSKKYSPKIEDIYMVKSGATTGKVAMVETTETFNIWSPLAVFRCNKNKVLPKFLLAVFNSSHFYDALVLNWSYGTQQNIGMGVLSNIEIPCPPLKEQAEIIQHLDVQNTKFDKLIDTQSQLIEKLKEYRSSIISHAVTGKIDVREFSA